MCGIAGIWATHPVDGLEAAVARMIGAQQHRGPDEQRTVTIRTGVAALVLGFDRLAILDLTDAGGQPMRHEATGSWLVFNGEIYDHAALRARLETRGHRFRSTGDTEVLLAALVEWGTGALSRLRGMYAFAFFDGRTQRLTLARDPFGIKPLLYGRLGAAVVFASELRAIRAAGLADLTIDREALGAYLAYGSVPEPHSIAREIRMLAPGHVVEVDARGQVSAPRCVLDLDDLVGSPEAPASHAHAVDLVETALADAVTSHLVSDVPLGVLLSGGVDSTLVASLAARRPGVEPQFLTVGFDQPRFNEVATARTTALRLGGRHHVVSLSVDDVLALLPDALAAMDQPTADGVNTFVITRAAAERGIRVLVSGLGGDELFGGYTTFDKAPFLAAHARALVPFGRMLAALGIGNAGQWAKVASAGGVRDLRDAYLVQRAIDPDVPSDGRCGLPEDTWGSLGLRAFDAFRNISALEVAFYLRSQLLHDADVFSSANSVELRVPFLDLGVLRAAWCTPAAWHRGRYGGRKQILKALLRRLAPGHPVGRAKMGFVFPWTEWLRGPLGERVAATLADRTAHARLDLAPDAGLRLVDAFRRGDPRVGWAQLWSRFVLVEWHRETALDASTVRERRIA